VYGTCRRGSATRTKTAPGKCCATSSKCADRALDSGRLDAAAQAEVIRRLAICESSDWFWWLGDYNSPQSVACFDGLFRENLKPSTACSTCPYQPAVDHRSARAAARRKAAAPCAAPMKTKPMPPAITLLLGVHAHQPVGNFPEVIEDAHQRCYKPFLHTLHAYPDFRFAAHFSGWLLDWLRERHPADMALLAEMVRRGQVELFSSGDTEPVLAAIPHRDRIGQLQTPQRQAGRVDRRAAERRLADRTGLGIRRRTGAGRNRHPLRDRRRLPFLLHRPAGRRAGRPLQHRGRRHPPRSLPISEALRYRLPFHPAHEVVAYLEQLADRANAPPSTSTTSRNSASGLKPTTGSTTGAGSRP
jgi:hypothetical protein